MAGKKTTTNKPAARKAATTKGNPHGKLSALDAAAMVLAAAKEPMGGKELIDVMAKEQLWISPGGKTPQATLYAAITREIATKGKDARFKKVRRGKFAANG
ncbi:MAG: hypothetical protein D6741_19880 [Planctomycetota bacterium]|nr:MAG: hypothetical protein D6741_19880 [Planctomycetota bacterium]